MLTLATLSNGEGRNKENEGRGEERKRKGGKTLFFFDFKRPFSLLNLLNSEKLRWHFSSRIISFLSNDYTILLFLCRIKVRFVSE
jgi:hypothetical protein